MKIEEMLIAKFIGNSNTLIIHDASCDYVLGMHPANLVEFEHLAMAYGQNYADCKSCMNGEINAKFEQIKLNGRKQQVLRKRKYGDCIVCPETRGIQMAHIIARRDGGVECMPLCPNHHWYYDHGLLTKKELKKILARIESDKGSEFSEFIRKYYKRRSTQYE